MAKTMTKRDKAERYDVVAAERDLLATALQFLARGDAPDASKTLKEDDTTIVFRLYGCKRAHGGILVMVRTVSDQTPTVEAVYLDTFRARYASSLLGYDAWIDARRGIGNFFNTYRDRLLANAAPIASEWR